MPKLDFAGFEDFAFTPYAPERVRELVQFDTDLLMTHNGTEERTAVRAIARQTFQYDIPTNMVQGQSPFNLSEQNIRGDWAVPIWTEAQRVTNVSGTTIAVDTINSDFRIGGLVLVFTSNDIWQLRLIGGIEDGLLTLTATLDGTVTGYAVPVNAGTVRGTIDQDVRSQSTTYSTQYEIATPRPHQTHIAVMFLWNHSDIMFGHSLSRSRASLLNVLTALSGAVVNSGIKLDLAISLWATSSVVSVWLDADAEDIAAAIALVTAVTATSELFPDPEDAMASARLFFGTTSPNVPGRKDYLFYITGSNEDTTAAAAASANLLNGTGVYSGTRGVQSRAIIFSQDANHVAGQQRELCTNPADLRTGTNNWSNDGATGGNSAETFGTFVNAYELGITGSGIRRQLEQVLVSHRTPYEIRMWIRQAAGSIGGGLLTVRAGPGSQDTEIEGALASPSIVQQLGGPIVDISATDLGSATWLWRFTHFVDDAYTQVIVGPGNNLPAEPMVLFAASYRRAIEPNPPTVAALRLDNTGNPVTVVSDTRPHALEDCIMRAFAPVIGYQFGGYEIITDEPDSAMLGKSIDKDENRVDFRGAFTTLSPWINSRITSKHEFPKDNLEEVKLFKDFLYRRLGRLRPVHLPTFQYDLHFTSIAVGGLSAICPNYDLRAFNAQRVRIAVKWADGYWQGLTITGVTDAGGGNAELTFATALIGNLRDIRQICFLGLARFNTDRVEINWVGYQVTDTAINLVEISK